MRRHTGCSFEADPDALDQASPKQTPDDARKHGVHASMALGFGAFNWRTSSKLPEQLAGRGIRAGQASQRSGGRGAGHAPARRARQREALVLDAHSGGRGDRARERGRWERQRHRCGQRAVDMDERGAASREADRGS